MSDPKDRDRLLQGRAGVHSVSRAAELLGGRQSETRALVSKSGVVKPLGSRRVVVWGELLDALLDGPAANEPPPGHEAPWQPKRAPRPPGYDPADG